MSAIVTVDYWLGGTSDLDREKLKQVVEILKIRDDPNKLPIGEDCVYRLVLEFPEQRVPKKAERKKKRKKRGR